MSGWGGGALNHINLMMSPPPPVSAAAPPCPAPAPPCPDAAATSTVTASAGAPSFFSFLLRCYFCQQSLLLSL